MAKLSRRFYDVLGEDVAELMVAWFNQVGDAYRAEWRQLYDANLSRADAGLEQRLARLELQIDRQFAEIDRRIAGLEAAMTAGFRELRKHDGE